MKICSKCKESKDLSEFYNNKSLKDGKSSHCKPCNRSYNKPKTKEIACRDSKNYALRHPEKVKLRFKKWYEANKNSVISKRKDNIEYQDKAKIWRRSNKDRHNELRRIARKNPSPKMILEKTLRDRFYKVVIRCKNGTKHLSCIKLIGCDFDTFKAHIESQFKNGMSWLNHGNGDGKWNIDHIKPLVQFDLHDLEQQKLAFHYTNLRPLWFIENITRERKLWMKTA